MNEKRTYGIEMEFASSVSHAELNDLINTAFQSAGSNHHAIHTNYVHNTDGMNALGWTVKFDSSIAMPDIDSAHPYGIEIASPVLKGKDGLVALKIVTGILMGIAKVGKTTGLHVHHGVKASEVSKIANSWLKIQDAIYKIVPPSRQGNRFCRKWNNWITSVPTTGLRRWYRRAVGTRYVGLNLDTYWVRGTVEFRMAAGSVDYEKISNWVIFTQMLVDKAKGLNEAVAAGADVSSFANLSNWLKGTIPSAPMTAPVAVLRNSTSETAKVPKAGTKSRLIWDSIVAGKTRTEIIHDMNALFVKSRSMTNSHYNMYKMLYATYSGLGAASIVVVPNAVNAIANDCYNAIEWACKRYAKFNREVIAAVAPVETEVAIESQLEIVFPGLAIPV